METKQKILVTGAGGFLGNEMVTRLLQTDGVEVLAVCHHDGRCRNLPKEAHLITKTADLENQDEWHPFFSEWHPDTVFHFGAVARLHAGQEDPERTVTVNLLGSMKLLELSARFGVRKFLFTSSDLAREAKSVVGLTKLLMEYYLQLFSEGKTDVVAFRMPNLYGFTGSVMDIFARQIAENRDLSITDERMARRFLTREEATDYLLFLKENGENHQVYSVKQEPIRIKDLALKMIRQSGKDLQLRIIGVRPGEKIIQSSYSDDEVDSPCFRNLARLKLSSPDLEKVFGMINLLPVRNSLKTRLQNKFKNPV